MNAKLLLIVLAGCATAPASEDSELAAAAGSEDAASTMRLAGGVTLQEVAVPSAVTDAMNGCYFTDGPVRRFSIDAPDGTSQEERLLGALQGLYFRTNKGGNFSLKKFCELHSPPITTSLPCATTILDEQEYSGRFALLLEGLEGECPGTVATVRTYLADELPMPGREFFTKVQKDLSNPSYWRSLLFDESVSDVILFRWELPPPD